MKYLATLGLSIVFVLAGTLRIASADQGISISLGRIDVNQRLTPGGRYHLPTVSVSNTGDRAERYEIAINYLEGTNDHDRPPRSWFDISPSVIDLAPGESSAIELAIDLATGAQPGSYAALIEAHPEGTPGGTKISAAAATRVSFTVKPANWVEAWRLEMSRAMEDYAPWSYVLPAFALGALLLYSARRSLRVRINVERKR